MASITMTLTDTCTGGHHLTIVSSGAKVVTVPIILDELTDAVSNEDAAGFIKVCAKLGKVGRTNAQLKTLFQSGVTVTI